MDSLDSISNPESEKYLFEHKQKELNPEQLKTANDWKNAMKEAPEFTGNTPEADGLEPETPERPEEKQKGPKESLLEELSNKNIIYKAISQKATELYNTNENTAEEIFQSLVNDAALSAKEILLVAERTINIIPANVINPANTNNPNAAENVTESQAAKKLSVLLAFTKIILGIAKMHTGDIDGAEAAALEGQNTADKIQNDAAQDPSSKTGQNKQDLNVANSASASAKKLLNRINDYK